MSLMPVIPPGLCAETDSELFFPESAVMAPQAKALCLSCESRMPCLTWALDNWEQGVWGGTSEKDRARIRRQVREGRDLGDVVALADARYYAEAERALTLQERKQAFDRRKRAENHAATVLAAERAGQVAA